jgi:hypothetical protein
MPAASSNIEVRHRDALIRLRSIIEEDLEAGVSPIQEPPTPPQPAQREAA